MPYVLFTDAVALDMFGKMFSDLNEREKMLYGEYMDDLDNPEYRPIVIDGNVTDYDVSNIGGVQNFRTGLFLSPYETNNGYLYHHLVINGKARHCSKHRLVAEAFIPNPENKPVVNHINTNTQFNWYKNLEWCTQKENVRWSIKLGHQVVGVDHKNSRCTEDQIRAACKMMEDPNVVINDIVKATGVPLRTINHIRFDNGWHHIAQEYNIRVPKRTSGPRYSSISMSITQMIMDGKTNDEIYTILDLTGASKGISRKSISDRIYHIRRNINRVE